MLTKLKSPGAAARWLSEWVTGTLRTDSRQVQPGDAFIAWPGYATDGRQYARAALDAGASTVLVEDQGIAEFGFDTDGHPGFIHGNARIGTLPSLKAATGPIAAQFYNEPSQQLDVVAVTGTNGKSSTAWWTAQALSLLGKRCGVVGTLGIGEPPLRGSAGSVKFTGLTTPDPVLLQQGFRRMADDGFAACAIEASSIGLAEHRLAGTRIRVAQFTNFTRDHLDYSPTSRATTWTTTATWTPTGPPSARCSTGRASRRRRSTSTTRKARPWRLNWPAVPWTCGPAR
jgi:UDP-N-acetylmuramyl tripeptide synthase